MKPRTSFIEPLESRSAPAVLTATVVGHMLKFTGLPGDDFITISADAGDPTVIHITDAINGGIPFEYTSPAGITSISVALLAGDDSLTFDNSPQALHFTSVTVTGGAGAKSITATDLTVDKNFSITNGITVGTNTTTLHNVTVGGNLSVKNGGGDSETTIDSITTNPASVHGNISITNGTGSDVTTIKDTNVGGNITVNDGHGNAAGQAGYTQFLNDISSQSIIKGNISVTNLDGDGTAANLLADAEVGGNVTFNIGKGNLTSNFTSDHSTTIIHGNLTMKGGNGPLTMNIGQGKIHGLEVMKNLIVTGGSAVDNLDFYALLVDGNTTLSLKDGANSVTIDDSTFAGTFNLTTGKDADLLFINSSSLSSVTTVFEKAVMINQGAGNDDLQLANSGRGIKVDILSTFIDHHGHEPGDFIGSEQADVIAPFGNTVQWID